ncbi:ABC transporter ATP-binding protein [Melghirimyces algeriensis]|uniref:ABC-2 type transport system ATP-binding protein n=1 Tax=Melghirimyces algeriensis TaxID=910412 RepID=A0A521AD00_9BACL|nr:ABC transporter ATP-binding protein [Melghirimyces algeriensis]SMO32697.1 ABC-2 type transport system ATP-binding protein [Melghirimyces algeriensis]
MTKTVVQTTQLTRRYGKTTVVQNVNLNIKQGEIYGFLGPNGAGKTTTIRMLLGLIRPSEGEIQLFGKDLHKERKSILKRVGSLVESPSYYGHLTGKENLEVARRILGVPSKRVDEVLEMVRLTQAAHKKVKQYSLGMKQRLGIATALLGKPELLILDEPTNGLDPSGIQEMREFIKELPREHGMSVLVSSHLLSEIEQMATQVGIIRNGKMIFQGSITSLQEQSRPRMRFGVGDANVAAQLLASEGLSVSVEEDGIWTESLSQQETAHIVEHLVTHRFSVYRVEEVKQSLEEIFLGLTEEGETP